MSGGGDEAELAVLRAGQVSKRLAQLRAVLDLVARERPESGRIVGLPESFDALAAVQRQAPEIVRELLSGPQVGAWAAWCLRRLTRQGATPVWVHLAHLGSIAAAAAIRAGVRVRVLVPVRAGTVAFPSVGRAVVPARMDPALAECVVGPAGVLLDGVAPAEWVPVRSLRTEAGGVVLDTRLDELDPYWCTFGIPVRARVGGREAQRWHDCLGGAWEILAARHPHRLATLAAAIRCLVPVRQTGQLGRVSASSADAAGAIALTEPTNATRLAATLIHESQHFRLSALHDLRPVCRPPAGGSPLLYSPWRNDPRGVFGLLHGIQAFTGVADFWLREGGDRVTRFEYARNVGQLRVATEVLAGADGLTPFGQALAASLKAAVDGFPDEAVPADLRRIAADLVTEHQAGWRLRNVVPDEPAVRALVGAWRRGEPLPVGDHAGAVTAAEPSGDNPLTRLVLAWLEDAAEVRMLAGDPVAFTARFPGTTPADLPLLDGDYAAARLAAITRIEDGVASHREWAALTVAHGRLCSAPARSPLAHRPELVRAAWRRIAHRAPAPLGVVLAGYEAGSSRVGSLRR